MDKLRIAPCASVSLSVGGGTVVPPTGARLAWGVASRAVSIRALCLIHISTDARRTGITGQEPRLTGCGEGRAGHRRSRHLVLAPLYFASSLWILRTALWAG